MRVVHELSLLVFMWLLAQLFGVEGPGVCLSETHMAAVCVCFMPGLKGGSKEEQDFGDNLKLQKKKKSGKREPKIKAQLITSLLPSLKQVV